MITEKQIPLYQVQVTDENGKHLHIGPATYEKQAPEQLAETINKMVSVGKEKMWHEARVVTIYPLNLN